MLHRPIGESKLPLGVNVSVFECAADLQPVQGVPCFATQLGWFQFFCDTEGDTVSFEDGWIFTYG